MNAIKESSCFLILFFTWNLRQVQENIEGLKVRGMVKTERRAGKFTPGECCLPPAQHKGCHWCHVQPQAS